MKMVLTKDEAKAYLGAAIVNIVLPDQKYRVTDVIFNTYVDDYSVEIKLEYDNDIQTTQPAQQAINQLGGSPPSAPCLRSGIETPGTGPTATDSNDDIPF